VIEEAANAQLPGVVFTYVWSLADEDWSVADYVRIVTSRGGKVRFVERFATHGLFAAVDVRQDDLVDVLGQVEKALDPLAHQGLAARLVRNEHPVRLDHKPSKRDLEGSRAHLLDVDISLVLNPGGIGCPRTTCSTGTTTCASTTPTLNQRRSRYRSLSSSGSRRSEAFLPVRLRAALPLSVMCG